MPWQTTWLIEVQIDFGIAAIAERGGDRLVVEDEVVAELVELAGGDAGLDVRRDEVERLGRQAAGPAHAGEAFGAVELDGALVAPPIVVAVVDEVAGTAHGPYLACDIGGNKAVRRLARRRPPLVS